MNIALWVIQALLALVFLGAGIRKVSQPIDKLKKDMSWVEGSSPAIVRLVGILEILGGLGLILPAATRILPWLTPVAAIGLALTMIGAIIVHLRRKEASRLSIPVVLLILVLVIVYGRFVLLPIA